MKHPNELLSANAIPIQIFRLTFQWPLILKRSGSPKLSKLWNKQIASKNLDLGAEHFQEAVYFHDFVQDFLYGVASEKRKPDAGFRFFEREDVKSVEVSVRRNNEMVTHCFEVDKHSLHLFPDQAAMLTFGLVWTGKSKSGELMLDEAQDLIDRLRRSYTAYWEESSDGPKGGRVPEVVKLVPAAGGQDVTVHCAKDQSPEAMSAAILECPSDDAPIFEHWRHIAGLDLRGFKCSSPVWRDPSDERIPILSFIALKKNQGDTAREVFDRVKHSDWIRIADAEVPGETYPYNPDFLTDFEDRTFYDRFAPHELMQDFLATRHLFGGQHYSLVTVSDGDDFASNALQMQFRRHYTQMALLARLEVATLLRFSSRLSRSVAEFLDPASDGSSEVPNAFEIEIADIRHSFLKFTHRYRFTGISSQVQGREMYAKWRETLGLDRLYEEVSAELESSYAYVRGKREERQIRSATRLAFAAEFIAVVGLAVALVSSPLQGFLREVLFGCTAIPNSPPNCSSSYLALVDIGMLLVFSFIFYLLLTLWRKWRS